MEKKHRLSGEKTFQTIFRTGRRVDTPFFSFVVRANSLSHVRFASIISKKTAKSAVLRNRIRRRIRGWVSEHPRLESIPLDLVVSVKKNAVDASRRKFYEELAKGTRPFLGS